MTDKEKSRPTKNNGLENAVSGVNMLRGFALSAIISGYILGPLLLLGGIPYWLYKQGIINKLLVVIAVILAFIISNALIFVKSKKLIENFNKKANIKDPTAEEVAEWKKNRPASYKYDDDEEED